MLGDILLLIFRLLCGQRRFRYQVLNQNTKFVYCCDIWNIMSYSLHISTKTGLLFKRSQQTISLVQKITIVYLQVDTSGHNFIVIAYSRRMKRLLEM